MCFDAAVTYILRRDVLADGDETTVYVVGHPLDGLRPRVCLFRQPRRLDWWCAKRGIDEAVVGGFYLRDPFRPLGDSLGRRASGSTARRSRPSTATCGRRCT